MKNLIKLNKLVSGYYERQKLEDQTPVKKPQDIDKDSGMFLFSPHANIHIKAANLAIDHTEYYFNQMREKIGDKEFSKFLKP